MHKRERKVQVFRYPYLTSLLGTIQVEIHNTVKVYLTQRVPLRMYSIVELQLYLSQCLEIQLSQLTPGTAPSSSYTPPPSGTSLLTELGLTGSQANTQALDVKTTCHTTMEDLSKTFPRGDIPVVTVVNSFLLKNNTRYQQRGPARCSSGTILLL